MLRDPFLAEHQPMASHPSTPPIMWVRSRVFDPGARRLHSLRKSRRRADDDRREYEREADGGENRPRKTSRRSEEEGKRASARGTKAATSCRAVPCAAVPSRAARAKKRCRACRGRAAESPLAGSSAARHFRAAAKIAARLARENARLRGRMDETQVGGARSAALMARLRGGMSNPSKTRLKSIKNTRDTRKRSRVTLLSRCLAAWRERSLGSSARARSN